MSLMQVIIAFMILFRMAYLGAQINDYADRHTMELIKLKDQLFFIRRNVDLIKRTEFFLNSYLQAAKDFLIFDKNDKNVLGLTEEQFLVNIDKCMAAIDYAIDRIQLESIERPLKLLILKLDFKLINQFYMALVTLCFSLVQKQIKK